jgi:peptidylprolyl isomerase
MRLARLLSALAALAIVPACTPTPTPSGASGSPDEGRAERARPAGDDHPAGANPAAGAQREPTPAPDAIPAPADVAAPPADAQRTESGLASKVLEPGEGGEHPRAFDKVTVNYTGWTTDGQMFDSSVTRGRPATFPLNRVIPGWTEGLQLMVKGEKRRLWIPGDLAYDGQPGRPQGTLVFDVELIDIERMPEPPAAPSDVAAAPADAQRTESGLASKVIAPGTGTEHPRADSTVTVHYTGWTTDGEMFDSSVVRGRPATFPLNRVIPGWTEGLQLMVVGEKRRLWIPANLAYEGRPGAPQGTLVFDVELLEINAPAQPRPTPTP